MHLECVVVFDDIGDRANARIPAIDFQWMLAALLDQFLIAPGMIPESRSR